MNRLIYTVILAVLFPSLSISQPLSYKAGEKVNYSINYGPIVAGVGTLSLTSEIINGREVLHSVLMAKTTGMAEAIFRLVDIYESYFDPVTELPEKSIRNIHEGRYKKYNMVLFDHKTRTDSAILTSDLTGIHIAPPGIHDIISCFYYIRNHTLPDIDKLMPGDMITVTTWFCDELYPIKLRYKGPDEVRLKSGRLKCYKFNPVTETGRLFKTDEDVSFWFSADKNFLPVKIRFDIFVGAFTVEILSYEGLMYPLETKKK